MKTMVISLVFATFIVGCATKKSNKEVSHSDKPMAELSLAPGYISSKLQIIKIEDSNIITAKVVEVFKYGSATSPLPSGTELSFKIPENYSEKVMNKIKVGNTINAILSSESSQMMMGDSKKQTTWTLISTD